MIQDTPSMNKGFWDRNGLVNIGAIEIPGGAWGALSWEDISKDCLPVFVYKSPPKALIAANRRQLESLLASDKDTVRELYIVEIEKLSKHSNLDYCAEMVEYDRKYKRKKKKLICASQQRALIKDIVENLNRTKTAEEIGSFHGTSKANVNLMAVKLRKLHHFKIPTIRGYSEFDSIAAEIAKERPDLLLQPAAKMVAKPIAKNGMKVLTNGGGGGEISLAAHPQ